jgi:hypothetical protein
MQWRRADTDASSDGEVGDLGRLRVKLLEDSSAEREEGRSASVPWAREVDVEDSLDPARTWRKHDESVGEIDRLVDVVSDEEGGEALPTPERLDLLLEGEPGEGVERAEGLVEEEDAGPGGEGSGEGDPLSHATRELGGKGSLVADEPDELDQLANPRPGACQDASGLKRESQVLLDSEPWEERGLLEHEARLWGRPNDPLARDVGGARAGPLEAGDELEERRLPAAASTNQADELAGRNLKGDVGERDGPTAPNSEDFGYPVDADFGRSRALMCSHQRNL